jgi:xylose isomerase
MYLLLKERARAFRKDPRVQEALQASGVLDLATPALTDPETWRDVRDKSRPDHLADRGYGYVRLNQLAIEHLMGVTQP